MHWRKSADQNGRQDEGLLSYSELQMLWYGGNATRLLASRGPTAKRGFREVDVDFTRRQLKPERMDGSSERQGADNNLCFAVYYVKEVEVPEAPDRAITCAFGKQSNIRISEYCNFSLAISIEVANCGCT